MSQFVKAYLLKQHGKYVIDLSSDGSTCENKHRAWIECSCDLDPIEIKIHIHYVGEKWVTYGNISNFVLRSLKSLDEDEFLEFFNEHGSVSVYEIRNYENVAIQDCLVF